MAEMKHRTGILILLVLAGMIAGFNHVAFAAGLKEEKAVIENPEMTVALDPGHGGEENGAWYYGRKEKDVNYRIAELVEKELSAYPNITVMLTRDRDEEIGLQGRVIRAADAGADVFVSLHLNASVSHQSNGATIYISTAERYREQLLDMADCLLGEFETLGLRNNGTIARVTQMGGRRGDGSFDDYYGVLRHSYNYGMPGLLIEHCFMDSGTDCQFLENEEELLKLATADANGIATYYGLIKKDGTKPEKRHAKVKGGTTGAIALSSFEPPNVNGIRLLEYDGKTPGIATYEVEVADEKSVVSLYLVYKNADGNSFTVSLTAGEELKTGIHEVKAYIPAFLEESDYTLSYIGASNEAGYDAGYNYAEGQMIGFGKCQWLNSFVYEGKADITVSEAGSISTAHARWFEYEVKTGLRDKRERYPAIYYPD